MVRTTTTTTPFFLCLGPLHTPMALSISSNFLTWNELWWVLLLALALAVLIAIATLLRRCIAHHRTPAPPAAVAGGGGAGVVGPSYGRTESERQAVEVVARYALHPGGRPEEPKRLLDERLLARLQSFSFRKPKAAAAVAAGGDVEAPSPPPAVDASKASGKEDDDAADRACLICTEPLWTERVVALPCGHIFHRACIVPWLRDHDATCPECRFVITPEMLGGTSRRGGGGGRLL